jgi:hypothetical protein
MSLDVVLRPALLDPAVLERAILHTLSYADVFDYPLTIPEIHRYLTSQQATLQDVAQALDQIVEEGAVAQVGEYFTLPGRSSIVATRRQRAEIANRLWGKARRYGRLIASLPFVRMLAVTGSLAMSNTERDKDIDFMLVTAPDRLWTCRALVILVIRLAALEGVNLCPNYLVTTNAMELHERSLYVAHEVAQMIPLSGAEFYDQIRSLNVWTRGYLPNASGVPNPVPEVNYAPHGQRFLEALLTILPVQRFERWEMQRKIRKLSCEQSGSPEAYFSADVCKGHADRHRQRTELLLKERLKRLEAI